MNISLKGFEEFSIFSDKYIKTLRNITSFPRDLKGKYALPFEELDSPLNLFEPGGIFPQNNEFTNSKSVPLFKEARFPIDDLKDILNLTNESYFDSIIFIPITCAKLPNGNELSVKLLAFEDMDLGGWGQKPSRYEYLLSGENSFDNYNPIPLTETKLPNKVGNIPIIESDINSDSKITNHPERDFSFSNTERNEKPVLLKDFIFSKDKIEENFFQFKENYFKGVVFKKEDIRGYINSDTTHLSFFPILEDVEVEGAKAFSNSYVTLMLMPLKINQNGEIENLNGQIKACRGRRGWDPYWIDWYKGIRNISR